MASSKTKFLFIIVAFFLITCQKEKLATREFPRLSTMSVTDISDVGAIFHGEVLSLGKDEIIDHGFVWSATESMPRLDVSEKVSMGPSGLSGPFAVEISTTLRSSVNYTVRAFLITSMDLIVYGQSVGFLSLGSEAPIIKEVIPLKGIWYDTITIKGSNFSNRWQSNYVAFDSIKATVISATDSILRVTVPINLLKNSSRISVSIVGNKASYPEDFTLLPTLPPQIDEIIPERGFFNDTLTILGENFFSGVPDLNKIKIDGVLCFVVSSTKNIIKVLVPPDLTEGQKSVSIEVNGQIFTKENSFYSVVPKIHTFTPLTGTFNDTITIKGLNFLPEKVNKFLTIGGVTVIPDIYNDSIIKFRVPVDLGKRFSNIVLTIENKKFSNNQEFELKGPEIIVLVPDYGTYGDTISITGNFFNPANEKNRVEIGGAVANVLSSSPNHLDVQIPYDIIPVDDYFEVVVQIGEMISSESATIQFLGSWLAPWRRLANYPTNEVGACASFTINDKAYVGMATKSTSDFWEYDPAIDKWTKLAKYPGPGYSRGMYPVSYQGGFSINNTGYVYMKNEFYAYYPETNTWEKKANNPTMPNMATSFVINDKAYIGVGENPILWEYNPSSNTWRRMTDFPSSNTWRGVGFAISGKGYIYSHSSEEFYEFDPDNDSWALKAHCPIEAVASVGFSIGGKGYIGTGLSETSEISDIYEYDPILDHWTKKANYPLVIRWAFGFSLNGKGYLGGGYSDAANRKVYEFDPTK